MESSITEDDLILVTGASGYIAAHIVKQLLDKGYRVRGTVRSLKNPKKVDPLYKLSDKGKLELVEADLMNESSWLSSVKDCTYVIHTASPFPNSHPKDEMELINPAVNGTLFVFRACVQPDSKVKRVVLTSSTAAVSGDVVKQGYNYSEKDWADVNNISAYAKSKTLAEKAAWDFLKEREAKSLPCFELAVINPNFVIGPLLHETECTSTEVIRKMMNRDMPMLPDIHFAACDVRDVALAHVKALTCPNAVNNRHVIVSTRDSSSFKDWALMLDAEFKSKNYNVPTTVAPNFLIKAFSLFDSPTRLITPMLGIKSTFDNTRMTTVLGIEPTEVKKSVIDMAYSLIEKNMIPKRY